MSTTHQTSLNTMLSIKVALIATIVLSAAIMLSTTDIAGYLPWIYNGVVSWLRPPYLYLVINFIIITIVASARLQTTSDDVTAPPPQITPLLNTVSAAQQQPAEISDLNYLISVTDYRFKGVEKGLEFQELDSRSMIEDSPLPTPPSITVSGGADDAMRNKENEFAAVTKSTWTAAVGNNNVRNGAVKPPASTRFSHRRNVKGGPEGGRTVLGVSKPKKQDTLENTWKTITEGRAMPISRHLKKSETLDRVSRQSQQENTPPMKMKKTMRKVETFNGTTSTCALSPPSGGSGKLRKEPSLSHDELNKRVEAFIKKFNEDMRLQRQDSFNQYKEMVNRGST